MRELVHQNHGSDDLRRSLLAGVSIFAFVTCIATADPANAEGTGQPQVGIELGGQLNELKGLGDAYEPPFCSEIVADGFDSPLKAQSIGHKGFSEELSMSVRRFFLTSSMAIKIYPC